MYVYAHICVHIRVCIIYVYLYLGCGLACIHRLLWGSYVVIGVFSTARDMCESVYFKCGLVDICTCILILNEYEKTQFIHV